MAVESEKGFILTTLLALIPALLAIALGFTLSSKILLEWHKTHKICRSETMKSQSQLGQLLRSLMLLNPQAQKLRLDNIKTTAKLAAAVANANPAAVALYTARLTAIKAKQARLDKQQKLILSTAKIRIQKWQASMNSKLRSLRLENPKNALAVEAWPKGAIAPFYKIKENFAEAQKIGATWSSPIRGNCFATLKQRRLSWIPALSEAKSFLR